MQKNLLSQCSLKSYGCNWKWMQRHNCRAGGDLTLVRCKQRNNNSSVVLWDRLREMKWAVTEACERQPERAGINNKTQKPFSVTTHPGENIINQCLRCVEVEKAWERSKEKQKWTAASSICTADRLNIGAAVALNRTNVGISCMCSAPHDEKSFVWSEQLLSRLLLMGFHHSGTNRMACSQNRMIRHPTSFPPIITIIATLNMQ